MLIFIWTIKINTCKLPIQEFWDKENIFNFKLDVDSEFSQASSQKGTFILFIYFLKILLIYMRETQ